jgi:hypothetical protein
MIKRLRTELVDRDVFSNIDQRKKVDRHYVVYRCPPDFAHPEEHEWLVAFEVRRGRLFDPPRSFKDKWEANLHAQEIIR